jgi:hypothetical protein
MKFLLTLLLLSPVYCLAQVPNSAGNILEPVSTAYCIHTDSTTWQLLQRPNPKNPLKTFYSITYSKGCGYRLALKISLEGINFIVPQDAKIEIESESGASISLNTEHKQRSSKGGGSVDKEDDKPGVTVTCLLSKADIRFFENHYPEHIRLYLPEILYGGRINIKRSEIFCAQMAKASTFDQTAIH